ncbi:MAG: YegS/Rv2252/BmrU family lipid kinase [Ruminococcaceae bacterium]|nr:YegS/Rv2252/BmrU family lipid kinase [Oscillospiraceae bacterium]
MKKLLLVVNPCAGQRKAKKHLAEIISVFNRAGYEVITHITEGQGDGEQAVIQYAPQVDMIVGCGGDGTFNETVSGVLKSGTDVPIGYIPAGSTNDFASSLRIPSDLAQAAEVIAAENEMYLDVGYFEERYFTYVASFGAFTKTSYSTPQGLKNALGHAAYILSGIQELSQLKPSRVRFRLSDGTVMEDDYIFGAISNSTSVGGILTISEDWVDLCDGKLELLLIRTPRDISELTECVQALRHQTYNCSMLTFVKTDGLSIDAPENMDWTLDGEKESGKKHINVECLHRAVRVCCKD